MVNNQLLGYEFLNALLHHYPAVPWKRHRRMLYMDILSLLLPARILLRTRRSDGRTRARIRVYSTFVGSGGSVELVGDSKRKTATNNGESVAGNDANQNGGNIV